MSHLSSIGFSIKTEKDFQLLEKKLYHFSEKIKAPNGFYVRFTDSSGAELYFQENQNKEIIGMNPHFLGKAKMKVCLTHPVIRGSSELDGAFYGWADPVDDDEPDTGAYPFVFDIPDFHTFEIKKFPHTVDVQISAFAHELYLYDNEQDFSTRQNFRVKLTSESFIPIPKGLLSPEEAAIKPPQAYGLFTGKILRFEEKVNFFTQEKFFWFLIKTLGGEIDVVSDVEMISRPPKVDGIVAGFFWLSGRIVS